MSKKSVMDKWHKRLDNLWKEYCLLRDEGCQIRKHYPASCGCNNEILQVHHVFSRVIKSLTFDVTNGVVLGQWCHSKLHFGAKDNRNGMKTLVDKIAIARDGQENFDRMTEQALGRANAFLDFKSIDWCEKQEKILTEMIENIDH